jgi:CRP-like cAMP-binding protein
MKLRIRPFEVSPYHTGTAIIKNPRSSRYDIISEYQASLLELLESNPNPEQIFFPASGVATSRHFEQVITLFRILGDLGLIEKGNEDSERTFSTNILFHDSLGETPLARSANKLLGKGLHGLARLLALLGSFGLIALCFINVAGIFLLLPSTPEQFFPVFNTSYIFLLLLFYVGVVVSYLLREVFRAALLLAIDRKPGLVRLFLRGPFLAVDSDSREIWMGGHAARMQMALLGIFSPLILAGITLGLFHLGIVSGALALAFTGASFFAAFLSAFPLASGDGEEILHLVLFGRKLEKRLALEVLAALHHITKPDLFRRRVVLCLLATCVWSFFWSDFLLSAFKIFSLVLANDIYRSGEFLSQAMAAVFILCFIAAAFYPVVFVGRPLFKGLLDRRRSLAAPKRTLAESVNWSDKLNLVNRLPLFAFLSESTRAKMLEDMQNHNFLPGEALVQQGEQGRDLFLLLKGEAQAVFRDATGKTHLVGKLRDGDAFGEVALIDDIPRTASIIAKTECYALTLSKEDFQRHILEQQPDTDRIKQMIRLSSFFKRHPLLSRMSASNQAAVIEKLRYRSATGNEEVLGPDQVDPRFFLVYTGRLTILGAEREQEFLLGSEDCFGYLLAGQNPAFLPRIKAKEGSGLLTLSQADFKELILDRVLDEKEIIRC